MPFAVFGPGSCYVTRTDISGATPINIGFINEFSLDEAAETKELYGQNQYALTVARSTIKTTGKMKPAMLSGIALNSVFHGQTFASGQLQMAQGEAATVPTASPYTYTTTNAATFTTDLGVIYASTGYPLMKVSSSPTAGQYSVNTSTGVYTFAAADSGAAIKVTYAYTVTGSGQTQTIANTPIGTTPTFQIDYSTTLYNKPYYVRVFSAVSTKLSQSFKLTDFMMPELDFSVFANAAGSVYESSFPEVS